jgi:hypothetical protein
MLREAALALFLIAVALGLWLADLGPLAVVAVMALALAVAWVIEWVSWREDQLQGMRPVREEIDTTELPGEPAPLAPAPRARGLWLLRGARSKPAPEPAPEAPQETGADPSAPTEAVAPEEAPAAQVDPEGPPAEPPPPQEPPPSRRSLQPEEIRTTELPGEPAPLAPAPRARGLWLLRGARSKLPAEPAPEAPQETGADPSAPTEAVAPEEAPAAQVEPEGPPAEPPPPQEPPPSRRRLRPVRSSAPPPPPAPEPEPEQPPQHQPEPQGAPVVPLWARSSQPREWNLWDLERIARAQSRRDPERFEEWSYLILHLRGFANADGMLPAEFDELVRENFGGLLEPAHGA